MITFGSTGYRVKIHYPIFFKKNKSVKSCVCLQVYLYLCIINSQHNFKP